METACKVTTLGRRNKLCQLGRVTWEQQYYTCYRFRKALVSVQLEAVL